MPVRLRLRRPLLTRRRLLIVLVLLVIAAALLVFAFLRSVRSPRAAFKSLPPGAKSGLAAVLPPTFDNPLGIAVAGSRLYVAESGAGVIRRLGLGGQLETTLTVAPPKGFSASYPSGVAEIGDDLVVVDQSGDGSVVLVSKRGGNERHLGADRRDSSSLLKPTAVTAGSGEIYVADSGTIKVLDAQGRFRRTLGASLKPRLTFVGGLLLSKGTLWVSDSNLRRVVAIDANTGDIERVIDGTMGLPRGITADESGRLFVADEFNRVVRVFSPSGKLLFEIGGKGTAGVSEGGALSGPNGVAWSKGRLYVTDPPSGRIRVYNVAPPK